MKVLEQCIPKHGFVGGVLDNGGDRLESQLLARAQPSLPHDELVVRLTEPRPGDRTNDDGLQNPDFADRLHQLIQVFLDEVLAWLRGVRHDVMEREVGETRTGNSEQYVTSDFARRGEKDVDRPFAAAVVRGNERADASPESGSLWCCHYCGAPRRAISAAASR